MGFSYGTVHLLKDVPADICIAIACQVMLPVPDEVLKIPPGIRAMFTHDDAASRCEDIISWRDKIVAKHWAM